jgi:GH24 family phage-related lysozyme (muramidase)
LNVGDADYDPQFAYGFGLSYAAPTVTPALQEVADQLRRMKRLWVGKGLDGLLRRREAEALMVENCILI